MEYIAKSLRLRLSITLLLAVVIDTDSRISTPWKIKQKDVKLFILIINDELFRICARIEEDEFYFEGGNIWTRYSNMKFIKKILKWPLESGIKIISGEKKRLRS